MPNDFDTSAYPLGSMHPYVLYNNAGNEDLAVNDTVNETWVDRPPFNRTRLTLHGMEQQFKRMLEGFGFSRAGDYVTGLVITSHQQYVEISGQAYILKSAVAVPYTVTGDWSTESVNFKLAGDAVLRTLLAAGDGDTLVGSTDSDGAVSTVAQRLDTLSVGAQVSKDITELRAAFNAGQTILLDNAIYETATPLVVDYSTLLPDGSPVSFLGYLSKRYAIKGESRANSIILATGDDYAVKLIGSSSAAQNFHGDDSLEDLTITAPDRVAQNTTNGGASGILCEVKASTSIKRYTALNLKLGMHLDGVLSSTLEDVNIVGCYRGIVVDNTKDASGPNGMVWSNVRVAKSTANGLTTDAGAASHYDTIKIEECGTMGAATCGWLLIIPPNQLAANIVITTPYFELCAGVADLYIDNQSTHDAVVTINGGYFGRTGARYCTSNIETTSSGGGKLTVLVNGVTHLGVAGYVPSDARPFYTQGPNTRIIPDENCVYGETTSLTLFRRRSKVTGLTIAGNGARLAGDTRITTSRTSLGAYHFERTDGGFGEGELGYNVTTNPCDSSATGFGSVAFTRFQPVSSSAFNIYCFDHTGAAVDGPITLQISSMRGGS